MRGRKATARNVPLAQNCPSVSRENTKPTICYFQRVCDINLSLHNKEGIFQSLAPLFRLPSFPTNLRVNLS